MKKLHSTSSALDHFSCTDSVGAVSAWLEAEAKDAVTHGESSKAREIAREIAPRPCAEPDLGYISAISREIAREIASRPCASACPS